MFSKHSHVLGTGRGTNQVNRMTAGPHSDFLAACLLHTAAAGSKCPFFSVPFLSPHSSQKGRGVALFDLPCLGQAQKNQTEQNREFERIISQTQGLLLGLDTVCFVTIYLCNCQAQRRLFIKGSTMGFFGMLNTSATLRALGVFKG